jgi:hypothetical protein
MNYVIYYSFIILFIKKLKKYNYFHYPLISSTIIILLNWKKYCYEMILNCKQDFYELILNWKQDCYELCNLLFFHHSFRLKKIIISILCHVPSPLTPLEEGHNGLGGDPRRP